MTKTDIFKNITSLSAANGIPSIIGGLFWLFIAGILSVEDYGKIGYILAISSMITTLAGIGTGNMTTVLTAKNEKFLSTAFILSSLSGIISAIIIFLLLKDLGASIYIIGSLIFGLITAELLGKKLYQKYALVLIIQRSFMALFALVFYYLIGIDGIILGIALSFFPFIVKIFKEFKFSEVNISLLKTKRNFLVNSYILDLRSVFANTTDKLIVVPLLGLTIFGNYQLGLQIVSLIMILPQIIYQYILPREVINDAKSSIKRNTIIISIVLTVITIILAPIVIPSLFPKFTHAVTIVQIMSLSTIPNSIVLMNIPKILGFEKNKIMIIGTSLYLAVLIGGIFILGNLYNIIGISTSVVLAASSEATYFTILRHKKIL